MDFKKKIYRRILFLTVFFLVAELFYLAFKKNYISIDPSVVKALEVILTFIISLLVCTIVLRLTENKVFNMFEKDVEIEQRIIITKLYSYSLYTLAFFVTFWKAGVSIGNLTIFVGLVASGFAFAIRDLLISLLGWFIILNKKPFHIGDYISIGEDFGLVTRIGTFHFTLEQKTPDEYIKIPNNFVLLKSIVNKGFNHYREEIKIPIKGFPDDVNVKCSELASFIRSRSHSKDYVKVVVDFENNNWILVITYLTAFNKENLKNAVLIEVHRTFGDYIKF